MKHNGATWTETAHEYSLKIFVIVLITLCLPEIWYSLSLVQAASPITSSGLNTQVTLSASPPAGKTQYDITGGTRPGGGPNLFHSFGNFNVPNNNIANFLNDSGAATTNILGRVTGGNISNIFGTIQTTGFGNANLFLMNPAGFLFGPKATLNVGGMVAFTTADYLKLGDGVRFNAIPDAAADALLSTAPVVAYGFLGSNPGAITVQGSQLSVADGTGISLVGGNITIQSGTLDNGTIQPARISAPNGQINLATTASPGEFLLPALQAGGFQGPSVNLGTLTGPNVNGVSFTSFGTLHLAPSATVDVSQAGNGKVSIIGGQLVVDIQNASLSTAGNTASVAVAQNNVLLSPGSSIASVTLSTEHGPDLQIVADNIQLQGTGVLPPPTPLRVAAIATQTRGSGDAGNISLTANQNLTSFFGQVTSNSPSTGHAGNIDLTSTQGNISLTNQTLVSSQGHPGTLTLNAPHGDILLDMSLANTQVLTPGLLGFNGGGIQVTANNLTLSNSQNLVPSSIEGDNFVNPQVPGNITMTLSGNLSMSGGSAIQTVSRGPAAAAADINITAHNVSLTGTGMNPPNPQVFNTRINTQTISSGTGGQLNIVADNLQLTNGGQLLSGSIIGRNPFTGQPTNPSGSGGAINIRGPSGPTTSVLIDGAGSGIFTNTQGSGPGGNTNITAQSVTIQNGGVISAQANGSGPGGHVNISTEDLQLINGGQLTSGSVIGINAVTHQPLPPPSGTAGDVTIQGLTGAAGSVLIDGAGSGIFTNTVGTGAAGNTNISTQSLIIQNGGTISAATSGTAPSATGGTITVDANQVQVNSGGLITAATTGAGSGGSININAGSTFSSNAGTVSSTATQATGGDINMAAGQSVGFTNGASISASSTGTGNAGNIHINAGNQFAMTDSSVTTEANQASGGAIKITTAPGGTVELINSTISASVLDGTGGGGSVNIDPQFVILQNSQILAQAVQGPGGNISITTNLLLADINSTISASSQFGQNGTITIQSPISPASGKIVPLSQKPLIPTSLLSQRCAALARGNFSSFTVAGRDSLPAEPGGWLSSPLAVSLAESGGGTLTEAGPRASLGEPAGEIPLLSLRQIAPPGFLTQAFAAEWSAGCQS